MENVHKKSLSVVRTTVKIPGRPIKSSPSPKTAGTEISMFKVIEDLIFYSIVEDNFEFHLVSMDGVTWHFLSACAAERDEWVTAIERQIMLSLQNNSPYKKADVSFDILFAFFLSSMKKLSDRFPKFHFTKWQETTHASIVPPHPRLGAPSI